MDSNNIEVSVIIPVYNTALYLEELINLLVNQNFDRNKYELIFVNDCSPDNSDEIIIRYKNKFPNLIKLVHQKENSGLGKTRDLGIKAAKGRYIMFVDSDDMVSHDFIRLAYETIKKEDADLVQFNYIYSLERNFSSTFYNPKITKGNYLSFNNITNRGRASIIEDYQTPHVTILENKDSKEKYTLLKKIDDISCNKIYKKEIIEASNLKFEKRIWEDTLFVREYALKSNKIILINNNTYLYWVNPKSLLNTIGPKQLALMIQNNDDIIKLYRRNNFNELYILQILNKQEFGLLKRLEPLSKKDRLETFKEYNPDNGEFSDFINPIYKEIQNNYIKFKLRLLKNLGPKNLFKNKVKRILKKHKI